jgi:large subunit ribosomal protein L13
MLRRSISTLGRDLSKPYYRMYKPYAQHPDGLPEYRTMSRAWIHRDTERWWLLDCRGQQLEHVARLIAQYATAQQRVDFRPGIVNGDQVVAINCRDVVMTGDQWIRTPVEWKTSWPGGKYRVRMSDMFNKDPCMVVWREIQQQVGHHFRNKKALRTAPLENVWLYEDAVHPHAERGLRPLAWNPSPVYCRYRGRSHHRWKPNAFMQ